MAVFLLYHRSILCRSIELTNVQTVDKDSDQTFSVSWGGGEPGFGPSKVVICFIKTD